MSMLSRRSMMIAAGAGLASGGPVLAQAPRLTAGEVVARVKANLGIPWNEAAYRDTFKIGGPDAPVAGICSTFGTNLLLMQKAAKAGLNMIITHEPTFWSDADVIDLVRDDPIYKIKTAFAARHRMVVWRIHDHWHARRPDGIRLGFVKAMGWTPYQSAADVDDFTLPPTTLGALAKVVARTLDTRSVKVIGDPNLPVSRVGYGSHSFSRNLARMPSVDCLVISEAREYDTFEYIRDTIDAGARKGAIIISHVSGEDEGMNEFARWLAPLTPEIPVRYIPTTDEFWSV